jgi:hypothetical protein
LNILIEIVALFQDFMVAQFLQIYPSIQKKRKEIPAGKTDKSSYPSIYSGTHLTTLD